MDSKDLLVKHSRALLDTKRIGADPNRGQLGYSEFSGQLETSRKTYLIASSKDLKHHRNPYSNSICTSLKIPVRQ
ncbi:hypothetical protein DSO57_1035021 [Entomophthora muscae]|uniref:Uncharacterized protein n=1 Tax=Entomophthora muscae TaxID=34485 RepID=A0ACC2UKS5_9FUNG|nr:hypothetical protein DSO57_1035021 [Entomophthora muscae]